MKRQRAKQVEPVQEHQVSTHVLSPGSSRLDSCIVCRTVQQAPLVTQASGEWLDRPGWDLPQQNPPKAG